MDALFKRSKPLYDVILVCVDIYSKRVFAKSIGGWGGAGVRTCHTDCNMD